MSDAPSPSRRGFLAAAGGLLVTGTGLGAEAAPKAALLVREGPQQLRATQGAESFWGTHQGGIVTPPQLHTYFATFDLVTDKLAEIVDMLRSWTNAAARMSSGDIARPLGDVSVAAGDSGDALDLAPSRLTITFGFGPGLFTKDGHDRYGLANRRPAALVDLPRFSGDQLISDRCGGDLSVQACADDPQVAFHAVRQLARLAYDMATLRWTQTGFATAPSSKGTPRNLMGFKDGTQQPRDHDRFVWVGNEGPDWMQGGSYLVARRIRMAIEHWDRTEVDFQEEVMGRHKYSGAPIGKQHEFDAMDLEAADKDGNPLVAETAHVRRASAAANDGAQILRRAYSYNDGTNVTAERWPPWRQGLEYDAGLFFIAYQRDPRTGFIKMFEKMAKLDALNQFTTHVGSGIFACPTGVAKGDFIGQRLFARG